VPIGLAAIRRANAAMIRQIGEKLRWIREAYEAREPLRHSQAQWAEALGIEASQLSRIENGKQMPPPDILFRVVYLSGASMDYVFFSVVSPEMMLPWLCQALIEAHPTQLKSVDAFLVDRGALLQSLPLSSTQKRQRRLVKRKR
jgi:transcriptional regulator with XRE-family HTH domain